MKSWISDVWSTNRDPLLVLYRVLVVVLAVPDTRSAHLSLESLEDVLRVRRIGFLAQLVVDGVSGREDEEVLVSLRLIQIVDAGSHQARLADAGGHGVAEGREVELRFDLPVVLAVFGRDGVYGFLVVALVVAVCADGVEIRESFLLRRSQAHGVFDFRYRS